MSQSSNQQNDMFIQLRLRSAYTFMQSGQGLPYKHEEVSHDVAQIIAVIILKPDQRFSCQQMSHNMTKPI